MRGPLGLAIALPAASLLGVVAPASAIAVPPIDNKSVAIQPAASARPFSSLAKSETAAAQAIAPLPEVERLLAQATPTADAQRPRQLTDLVSTAAAAPTADTMVDETEATDEEDVASDDAMPEAAIDEDEEDEAAIETTPPVIAEPTGSTTDAAVPIPHERVQDNLQFLDPDPNPLLIQTQPEEVEIIGTQPLSLDDALALSYRNNPDLQVALLELERSESALREAQAANFPTLSINGTIQGQNTTSGGDTQLVPTPGGGFTFESETTEELGVSYSTQAELVYNLFSSGRRSASIAAAAEQVQLALLEVERRREELRLATASEYYDLQAAIEAIRISQAFLTEAERNLQDTTLREEVGVGTRFDVLRAEVQVANARQDLVNAERSRQVAQRALARRLNVPPSLTITTVPVDIAGEWPLSLEESIVLAYQNRAELEQQLTQRDVNELLRRVELAALGPQVNLFANYSISDFFNQEDRFSDNYAFGARVSWTIFEGGAAQARARQRELDAEIAERNFEETRNTVRLGVESAYYNLQSNQTNIGTARLAVTQAQEALDLAILRFDAGVGTQLDILNAQSELTNAEVNLVQAIVGYNRSLAELERAVSNLPESYYEELPY
ncbi:TolC family protein [Leptolyngbya iicbica]|nr:TolC family protein [Leptolyngbya sp. LK]